MSKTSKCPMCKEPTVHAFRPFCSKRCKMVDLGGWLTGAYAVPGEETQDTTAAQDNDEAAEEEEDAGLR